MKSMKLVMLILSIALTGCSTVPIYETIKIPQKYLTDCQYGKVELDETDQRTAFIQLAEYALILQNEIDRCNNQVEYIRKYQEGVE